MSRNPSDASPDARREEAVARRLGESLERLAAPAQGQCLEAAQIAAYHQRTLAPEEAEECEAHFAACSRCREVLALLAATEEVAPAGRLAAAAAAPARPAARPRFWRLLWLAPALAATASVALWLMVRTPSRTLSPSLESSRSPLIAEAPAPEQLTPSENESPAPSSGREREEVPATPNQPAAPELPPAAAAGSSNAPVAGAPPPDQGAAAAKSEALSAASAQGASAAAARVETQAEAQTAAPATAAQAAAPPPPAAPTESAANTAPAPPQAAAPAIRAMNRTAAPPPSPQASGGAAAPVPRVGSGAGAFAGAIALSAFGVTLRSPSGAISWRAGAAGRIERSANGGRTWQAQPSPLGEDWLAGSAVSDTVCWLVGRNGAIARTDDGQRWQRVAPPPTAADASGRLPDWVSVTATDARTATIASATQKFLTQDAGSTWQPQP